MTYTAPEIVLIITAVGAIIQNTVSIWRSGNKIEDTLTKTTVIEGHVNSQATRYEEKIIALQKEVEILKQIIVDKDKMAALLAQVKVPTINIEAGKITRDPNSATRSTDIEKVE